MFWTACDRGGVTEIPIEYPDATVYDHPPSFIGEWIGEIGPTPGVLTLGELGSGRYFGAFKADDASVEYALMLEQATSLTESGSRDPTNQLRFTWQDGLGSRGHGWLLINREETALRGDFGLGRATRGVGEWTFVRVDEY